MKKVLLIILALLLVVAVGCASKAKQQSKNNQTQSTEQKNSDDKAKAEQDKTSTGNFKKIATIETTKGKIVFEMYPEDTPKTVANFEKLAKEGFYNGLIFHRVEPGFVIQGGDPTGTGTGGSAQTIPAEIKRKHTKGAVGMARSQALDSASSQFYITLDAQPGLDGAYTVFGQVIEGMDVAEKIQIGDKMTKVTVTDEQK